jgi:hypothetical protein
MTQAIVATENLPLILRYSNFTLSKVKNELGIVLEEKIDLFPDVQPISPSDYLTLIKAISLLITQVTKHKPFDNKLDTLPIATVPTNCGYSNTIQRFFANLVRLLQKESNLILFAALYY